MPIHSFKPTSPGRRGATVLKTKDLTDEKYLKKLTYRIGNKGGRNAQGKITVRHQGGGAKKLYRMVDFRHEVLDVPGRVELLEYDPNRSARIARVVYHNGIRCYVLAVEGLQPGDTIITSRESKDIKPGNRMPLKYIPAGVIVSQVELTPTSQARAVRSAGLGATVMSKDAGFVHVRLPSSEVRRVREECMATVGVIGNADHRQRRLGKAGRMRHQGVRPRVRGKAMNPVDHPHGGGEGLQPIGLKGPKTPWGKYALGVRTRNKKKKSAQYIVSRRKGRTDR